MCLCVGCWGVHVNICAVFPVTCPSLSLQPHNSHNTPQHEINRRSCARCGGRRGTSTWPSRARSVGGETRLCIAVVAQRRGWFSLSSLTPLLFNISIAHPHRHHRHNNKTTNRPPSSATSWTACPRDGSSPCACWPPPSVGMGSRTGGDSCIVLRMKLRVEGRGLGEGGLCIHGVRIGGMEGVKGSAGGKMNVRREKSYGDE